MRCGATGVFDPIAQPLRHCSDVGEEEHSDFHGGLKVPACNHSSLLAVNGRITDILRIQRFNSREDMGQTLLRDVALYNHRLPQSALDSKTPMRTIKE